MSLVTTSHLLSSLGDRSEPFSVRKISSKEFTCNFVIVIFIYFLIPASFRVAAHITSTVSSCSRRGFFQLVSTAFFTSSKISTLVFSPSVSPNVFTLFLDSFFGLLCFRFHLTRVSSIILFRARTLVVLCHGVLAN